MWNVKWYLHLVQVTVTSFPAPPPRSTSPSQCLLFIPSGLLPLRAMFDNVWSEKFKFLRRLRFHFLCAMQCRLHVWTRVVATSVWSIWYLVWSGHWTSTIWIPADLDWTGMRMLTLASLVWATELQTRPQRILFLIICAGNKYVNQHICYSGSMNQLFVADQVATV